MTQCHLCEVFQGKKTLFHDDTNELHNMYVCNDCKKWLDNIVDIRTRYVKMVKDLVKNDS